MGNNTVQNMVLLKFATFSDDPFDSPNEDIRTLEIINVTLEEVMGVVSEEVMKSSMTSTDKDMLVDAIEKRLRRKL
jgi:hypothetical protein